MMPSASFKLLESASIYERKSQVSKVFADLPSSDFILESAYLFI